MAEDKHIYGEVNSKTSLRDIFLQIRKDIDTASSRGQLTELHRRAGYLITLSHAPAWEKKFGDDIDEIRDLAEKEFARTARKVNRKAKDIGTEADYSETWGPVKEEQHD